MIFSNDKIIRIAKYIMILSLLLIFMVFPVSFAEEATWDPEYHPEGWISTEGWWNPPDRRGCYMSVYNTRTRKYAVGVYNRLWPDNIIIDATSDNSYRVGDTLNCYAYTSYSGGTYWVYQDDVLVKSEQAGTTPDHFEFTLTISARKTKISCSASAQSRNGEELSVTIIANGDFEKPVITLTSNHVAVGTPVLGTATDNDKVVSWCATNTPDGPSNFTSFSTPKASQSLSINLSNTGVYYIWVKDATGNVSLPAQVYIGEPPKPATRVVSGQEEVISPYDVEVREGENATFSLSATGTAPLSFQWYTNSTASTTGGTLINGATSSDYTINNALRNINNKYYYCKITNDYGTAFSRVAKLTVYYAPVLATITGNNIIQGGSYTLTVNIQTEGNTDNYTYQWFKASSSGGVGSRIVGATGKQHVVRPTANSVDWYYCEVYNSLPSGGTLYITTSNYAKVVSDVSKPVIELGSFNEEVIINSSATIDIPVIITDLGQGYEETSPTTNFIGNDVQVLVNNEVQTSTSRSFVYEGKVGERHQYKLRLSNVTSNGKLSLKFVANAVKDKLGNTSELIIYDTKIEVDNIAPVISLSDVVGGFNGVYFNKDASVKMILAITESISFTTSEFTASDLNVRAGGTQVGSCTKTLNYANKNNNVYLYNLTLSDVLGDGALSLHIPAGKIKDVAGNANIETIIDVKTSGNENLIVDNTIPVIADIVARLESYTASKMYPSYLEGWHENWSNQDIFVTITATDRVGSANGVVDSYMVSFDNGSTYSKLTDNKNQLTEDFNGNVWYKVLDKAGNYSEAKTLAVKLDKTKPIDTPIGIYELRVNGADYVYKEDFPVNKTIYIYPQAPADAGTVKSGVKKNPYTGSSYVSYYTITHYDKPGSDKVLIDGPTTYNFNEPVTVQKTEDGYYEIEVVTTDLAGNETKSPAPHKIFIRKHADNIIRIDDINDVGSGPKKLTIEIHKDTASGPLVGDKIIVDNPYKEYSTAVGLGRGTFYVVAKIEDGVGLTSTQVGIINNDF